MTGAAAFLWVRAWENGQWWTLYQGFDYPSAMTAAEPAMAMSEYVILDSQVPGNPAWEPRVFLSPPGGSVEGSAPPDMPLDPKGAAPGSGPGRGLLFRLDANVAIATLEIDAADGSKRDFPVHAKTAIFTLKGAEKTGPLALTAVSETGVKFQAMLPDPVASWDIQVDDPHAVDPTEHAPGLLIFGRPWKQVATVGGGILALVGAAVFLGSTKEEEPETREVEV